MGLHNVCSLLIVTVISPNVHAHHGASCDKSVHLPLYGWSCSCYGDQMFTAFQKCMRQHVHLVCTFMVVSCIADVRVGLQTTTTTVMGAATLQSTIEDTMVMSLASSTAVEEPMLLLPLLLLLEAQLLLQLLPLAGNC